MEGASGDDWIAVAQSMRAYLRFSILGGVIGAVTGSGSRADDIVTGAIVGGIAGGVAGNIMDRQAAELRNDFGNGDIEVINTGNELIVRMPNAILFDTDSAALKGNLRSDLFVLADSLNKYPQSIVTVTGHTDNTGSAAYNQDLSERRANATKSARQSSQPSAWARISRRSDAGTSSAARRAAVASSRHSDAATTHAR